MANKEMNSNIRKIYIIKIFKSGMFSIPIIILFFTDNGLTMSQILILQALFSVTEIAMEFPTGYFADNYSRKWSIIIGGILSTLGYVVYSLSYGFWGFLCAEVMLGMAFSFISGADNAMIYDALAEEKKESDYIRIQGKNDGGGMISEALTGFIGGFMALVSLRFPLYWDAVLNALMIPVALTLVELPKHRMPDNESNLAKIWKLLKFSLNDHAELKWLLIYSGVVSAATLNMVWFIQPYWKENGVPLELFGSFWALLQLSAAFFSWHAHRIEKFLGRKKSLVALIFFPVAGYFLLGKISFVWSGIFILLFYVTRGINNPVLSDYINGLVSSDIRASILSVKNLVGRLIFSIVGPLMGWVNDLISLGDALLVSGATFLLLGTVALLFMRRHKAL